jgi:hypothetical protein
MLSIEGTLSCFVQPLFMSQKLTSRGGKRKGLEEGCLSRQQMIRGQ